eukprot:361250-Chlamydomonas_euryale.AAC.10
MASAGAAPAAAPGRTACTEAAAGGRAAASPVVRGPGLGLLPCSSPLVAAAVAITRRRHNGGLGVDGAWSRATDATDAGARAHTQSIHAHVHTVGTPACIRTHAAHVHRRVAVARGAAVAAVRKTQRKAAAVALSLRHALCHALCGGHARNGGAERADRAR